MTLFDDFQRIDASPSKQNEPIYDFLNRVATPFWDRVRNIIEEWVSQLPNRARVDITNRLKSGDDQQFNSAFWEVYLYKSFCQLDFQVSLHPDITNSKRPDFLIESNKAKIYVEATVPSLPPDQIALHRRYNDLIDSINRHNSNMNYYFHLGILGIGPNSLSMKKHLAAINRWLTQYDVDYLISNRTTSTPLRYPYIIEDDGWSIEIEAIPRGPEFRNKSARRVGMHYVADPNIKEGPILLPALLKKAKRYGDLDLPYIIAVYHKTFSSGQYEAYETLFGNSSKGLWQGKDGHNNKVSGVLIIHDLYPHNFINCAPEFWHNPWASEPVDNIFPWSTNYLNTDTNEIQTNDELMKPYEIFGISKDWLDPSKAWDT